MEKDKKSIENKFKSDAIRKIKSSGLIGYSVNKSNAGNIFYMRDTVFRYGNRLGDVPRKYRNN